MRTFKNSPPSRETSDTLNVIAEWLHIETVKPWLIIYGNVGNGKTTTIKAIERLYDTLRDVASDTLIRERYKMSPENIKRYEYIKVLPKVTMATAQYIADVASSSPKDYENLKRSQILLIDELGTEPSRVSHYGTDINPIAELLYHRYDRKSTTIMTSNKNESDLNSLYKERIADRFEELAWKVGYTQQSFRRSQN